MALNAEEIEIRKAKIGASFGRAPRVSLIALCGGAFAVRAGLALASPNIFHPDEIYQTLETAHRLAFGYGISAWEWREAVRSWIFPALLAGVMRATAWIAPGSTIYVDAIVIVLSLLSLVTVIFAWLWARRASGPSAAWLAAIACAFHIALVFFGPKTFSEVAAANLLLPGLYLGAVAKRPAEQKRVFLAGFLCAAAVCLRVQLLPTVLFALVWFAAGSRWRQRTGALVAGAALPAMIAGLVDQFTWGHPWASYVNYIRTNLTGYGASFYDTRPAYWYLELLLFLLGGAVLFLWRGARRSPFLAFVAAVYIGSHSGITHKEVRFLYPMIPVLLTLGAIGAAEWLAKSWPSRLPATGQRALLIACGLLLTVSPALRSSGHFPWHQQFGALPAMERASVEPDVCGVGLYGVPYYQTGGYTYLHQNAPLYQIGRPQHLDADKLTAYAPAANLLLVPQSAAGIPAQYQPLGCWYGVCAVKRSGGCATTAADQTLQQKMIATRQ